MARIAVSLTWPDARLLRAARNGDVYADAEGTIWRKDPYGTSGRQRANVPGRRAITSDWLQLGDDGNLALTPIGQKVLDAYEEWRKGPRNAVGQCGTLAGHMRHRRRNEKPCEACRRANADWHLARLRALTRLSKEFPERLKELLSEELAADR